jgi:uncharacterized protein YaaN involved in tellurite resistance
MNRTMQLKARIKNLTLKNQVSAQAVLQNFMMERNNASCAGPFI